MIVEDGEYLDFSKVPESKGISNATLVIVLIGIIGIFIMGGLSVVLSGYGHLWPAQKTVRMDLGTMPAQNTQP